jgi:sugar/nucleoside kinase (ribokinase family)
LPEIALACGHVTLDRLGGRLEPGGSAWYAARAWHALGARARILTAAGADFPREALSGVEAAVAPAERTTRFVNRAAAGGRREQQVEAVAPPLDPALLPAAWRTADVLFLSPVLGEVDLRAFAGEARARTIGIGVQGWVRAVGGGGGVTQPRWDFDPSALAGVGTAFLGEDDLEGQGDLVARLARAVPVVVLTLGPRGCEVIAAGRTRRVAAFSTVEVDPTGAGDVFAAAFLLGLSRGLPPVEAARLGAAAASVIVEGCGGTTLGRVGEAWGRARVVAVDAVSD